MPPSEAPTAIVQIWESAVASEEMASKEVKLIFVEVKVRVKEVKVKKNSDCPKASLPDNVSVNCEGFSRRPEEPLSGFFSRWRIFWCDCWWGYSKWVWTRKNLLYLSSRPFTQKGQPNVKANFLPVTWHVGLSKEAPTPTHPCPGLLNTAFWSAWAYIPSDICSFRKLVNGLMPLHCLC